MVRKSKGRQKIEMVKMNNESNLQVTFSKRRSGLFKKASELCTLCGAEVAIIVFSPGRKVFSFGHPCVETIIDRFMNRGPPHQQNNPTMQLIEAHRNATVRDLNNQLTQVLGQLEMEKKRGEELSQIRKANKNAQNWWESPLEELNMTQLTQLKTALDDLKKTIASQASKLLQSTVPPPNYYMGSSSNNIPGAGGLGLNLFDQRIAPNTNRFNPNVVPNNPPYTYNNNQGFKQEQTSSSYDPQFNNGHNLDFGPNAGGAPY